MARRKDARRRGQAQRVDVRSRAESLEPRMMLAVTAAEYNAIRGTYPSFGLPADMGSINIIEISASSLSVASMKAAISAAAATTLPDLVVARTTASQHTITYAGSLDGLAVSAASTQGALTVVGFGETPLTVDAATRTRVLSVGSGTTATTLLNLGNLILKNGLIDFNDGGGIYQRGSTLVLQNVIVTGNSATSNDGDGGGIYSSGGTLAMIDVIISENVAGWNGGGVCIENSTSTLTDVAISHNSVSNYGGGAYLHGGVSALRNVAVLANTAAHPVYATWGDGGGIYLFAIPCTMVNITVAGNVAESRGGGIFHHYRGSPFLFNSVVAKNTASSGPDIVVDDPSTQPLSGANNFVGIGAGQTTLVHGVDGNLVGTTASPADPLFVDASGADARTWNLRLQAGSYAVNAGDNAKVPAGVTTDLDGDPRIIDGVVDMGAYEYSEAPTNHQPTDIVLAANAVAENRPSGTAVGAFSTTDADTGDTFTYALVSGTGSTDNASFTISGNQLLTAASFDFEGKSSYSIRVRTTDQGGLYMEKVFTITVTDVDEIAPTVTAVYVRGSSWNANYLSFLAANMSGSSSTYGYAIPVGSGDMQLQALPWRNLDRISIAFIEDVSIAQAQFAIMGSVGSYSVSGFSYSSTDHVATWSLSAAISPDRLYVALPGTGTTAVKDIAGNVLDGEWDNPSSYSQVGSTDTFPSGNGSAGADFAFRFDVLPGDSTGGSLGKVNVADVAQTKSRSTLPVTSSSYRSDFDGNNLINVADVAYVKSKSTIYSLPVNPPLLPVFGSSMPALTLSARMDRPVLPVFSQVNLLLSRKYLLWG